MIRLESLALAIGNINGCFDTPDAKAFKLRNPGLLRSYRPEKKVDSDHYREFTSVMGGYKALLADILAKCSAKNHKLTPDNTLRDLLGMYGFSDDRATRKIILFMQKSLSDESVTLNTKLSWLQEQPQLQEKV